MVHVADIIENWLPYLTVAVLLGGVIWRIRTWLAGPIAACNVAATLMPALAGWTAFLLCRHLTSSFWPSFAGFAATRRYGRGRGFSTPPFC